MSLKKALGRASASESGDRWRGYLSDANLVMEPQGGGRVRLEGEFRDAEPITWHLELDPERLLFSRVESERAGGKVPESDLLAFVDERTSVTARDVMDRFGCSKVTALFGPRRLVSVGSDDRYPGQLHYFRTVQ
jgi:hypothetical protein